MSEQNLSRRNFLKTLGLGAAAAAAAPALAAGSALAAAPAAGAAAQTGAMPTRVLGASGVKVPILALGGMFDTINNQLLLRQALNWGVTYWDTAEYYGRGQSEEGMGRFLAKNPDARKDIFLVTKLTPRGGQDTFPQRFEQCLARLNTSYVDMFFVHGIDSMDQMPAKTRAWAAEMKKAGKMRLFGFSTHANMESLLLAAAKEGGAKAGIDGVMLTYNAQVMLKPAMREAVEAATKAGIGLVAMKTQAKQPVGMGYGPEDKIDDGGIAQGQAKLKAVWENAGIASICSQMPTVKLLAANVAAAKGHASLSATELKQVFELACAESAGYCAGCGQICQQATGGLPVNDIMRGLMYRNQYGEPELGRRVFAELPADARRRLAHIDYSLAEAACPHRLEIARLMREAAETLA